MIKLTKEEQEKVKRIKPPDPPLQRITALADYLLLNTDEHYAHQLVETHNKQAYREVVILASIQIETFLKGILVHKGIIKDDDEDTGFYQAIGVCYAKNFIPEDMAIGFNKCRLLRNQYAHELFTHSGHTLNDLRDELGQVIVCMIESREQYQKYSKFKPK